MIAILEDDTPRDPLSRRGMAGGAVAAAVLALTLAGFSPVAPPNAVAPVAATPEPLPPVVAAAETAKVPAPAPVDRRTSAATPTQARAEQHRDSVRPSRPPAANSAALLAQNAASGDEFLLAHAMRAVPALSRDNEKSVVLAQAAYRALRRDAGLRDLFFAALESIASEPDRTVVLVHATANAQGFPAVTERVLRAAARMRSPESASAVLLNVAQRGLVTSRSLRALYVRAADAIASDAHRQQVMTALHLATRNHP